MKKYLLMICICMACLLTGCKDTREISSASILFDTVVTITLYGKDKEELIGKCFAMGREYEQLFSRTIEDSEISRINSSKGEKVLVSDDTKELIEYGLYYSELSNGAFDITICPVSSLWNFSDVQSEQRVPDEEAIKEAVSHVGYEGVHIEGNEVWLDDPDAALDLGGIAKGFIADKMKAFLVENGVENGIINLGGNVLTIGTKLDGSPYRIGVQYPFKDQNEVITVVEVADQSMVSSGVYERYFYENDVLYHHILDPSTGYPCRNNILGVTIISSKSVDGDGLSTTCFVLGLEEGMKLIKSLDGVEAVFIKEDYSLVDSRDN